MEWIYNDGGREAAGFSVKNDAGDCVARALTIANGEDYTTVYRELAHISGVAGGKKSARDGVPRKVYDEWLAHRGWVWHQTMRVGQGCSTHLRANELPGGTIIVRLSRHLCAVIDGVIHDTHNPSRGGTRCVYGYWIAP